MKYLTLICLCLTGCFVSPQQKGTTTISDRGTLGLTKKGDRLLDSGIYAKKDVSADYAEGYVKGMSDQVKREWEDMQNQQRWLHFQFQGSRADQTNNRRKALSDNYSEYRPNFGIINKAVLAPLSAGAPAHLR